MEFIRRLTKRKDQTSACVATIGNFDGVHLGHQTMLNQLKSSAKELGLVSTVLLFEPQPVEFFCPDKAPSRLTRLREKLQQFAQHDIKRVVCLRFNDELAALSAAEFVETILLNGLVVKKLIVGDDFRFSKDREGDYHYLIHAGQQYGFDVSVMRSFNIGKERVSSTLIRQALAKGDISKAAMMLGRPYRISGRVAHGDKRGQRIGFATANIELHRYLSPVEGIFSGRVYGVNNDAFDAVIYVGSKPVYHGKRVMLEVHLLDFEGDLYGRYLQVEFFEKLRGEENFKSEHELIIQIEKDVVDARRSLSKLKIIK